MDLTALAKELRELRIEETNRPLKKVTDYSSSSEESESSEEEEEDGENETHDGTVPVSDIPRLIPTGIPGSNEPYNMGMVTTHGLETSHADTFSNISREGTLMVREYGMGSSTKASFTPFVDTRVYQTSPTDEDEDEDEESSATALFTSELLRQEQAKLNEARKISVVNVNPTNIRPHSDTPEIRKYKKRFNSEILCAALWGVNLLVGTENGLMLLDRSGQGKVYNLINRRRFQQMDVLEGLNVLVTISDLQHKPLLVDLTVEEGQRLKVIFGSHTGFHVIDVDSGNSYDIYIPSHVFFASVRSGGSSQVFFMTLNRNSMMNW
ncbi:traf2 and nck-interacting protein kinase isoform x6 [Limosa lapponica baueri]|uniref:non-specific serine/threonine protein kinase n=1 Tax=Limosa lapponica baueri TaxID=1758121 RepID=A0A2I0TCZ0_LIMLA|nr:traf2 and nck-interacting protein kinase isoform x6 [Limosa lapponica baueri]